MSKPLLPPAYFLIIAICAMLGSHILLPLLRVLSFPWTLAGLAPALVGAASIS